MTEYWLFLLIKLLSSDQFKRSFRNLVSVYKELPNEDKYKFEFAKHTEKLISMLSNDYFKQVPPGENHYLDADFGDLYCQTDRGRLYFDLKCSDYMHDGNGTKYTGYISKKSIKNFRGDYYICINLDLTKVYIVPLNSLKGKNIPISRKKIATTEAYGEVDYKKLDNILLYKL